MNQKNISVASRLMLTIDQGKQLMSVFNQAKGAYQDKKNQIKTEKSGLSRAQTFDPSRSFHNHQHDPRDYYEEEDDYYYQYDDDRTRRRSVYDGHSEAPSRRSSRRSRSVASRRHDDRDRERGTVVGRSRGSPLTVNNLKTHSEVSSTAPSRTPPNAYRSPYVETVHRDMAMSKGNLTHADVRTMAVSERRPPMTALTRRRSFSELHQQRRGSFDSRALERRNSTAGKEVEHLAYGNVPPDLQHRTDLDKYDTFSDEKKAKNLVQKVEGLLDEAHCLQHSATSTISHLQKNPDAAAAVALSLAELSTLVAKMSPAVIGFMKGGSPAVFALLASPQFLIGSAAVVGVTVVMFGGWKIVKRVKEQNMAREALAHQGVPLDRPAPLRTQSEFSTGMDEALIIDEELSTIESWRRGILPEFGENESADMELMTPGAERAHRERHKKAKDAEYDELRSRKSGKTTKTNKTSKKRGEDHDIPERRSSRHAAAESVAGSERSDRTRQTSSRSKSKVKAPVKTIEDGRSRRGDSELDLGLRPKGQKQNNMLKALFKDKTEKAREMVYV